MSKKTLEKAKVHSRPPVVTILGHVDHGKTTLLDYIRKSSIAAKEHGGITQHTRAFQVQSAGRKITFIDTPGHAAFSAMRSRGAAVTDLAVLVVAADDGVMPQTKESISHIKAANIPLVVAINKIDVPGANLERVKKGLAQEGVLVEGYGGDVVAVPISAKTGQGVDELLEMIGLVADMMEKKPTEGSFEAVVIDSGLDRYKGPVATLLIKQGTLKRGDQVFAGASSGKVKSLITTEGEILQQAEVSQPVEILGLDKVPSVGEVVRLGQAEKIEAKVGERRNIFEVQSKEIRLILKADTAGSLEAIEAALSEFETGEGKVKIVHKETGEVNESDIHLASATKALVIAFNVVTPKEVAKLAEEEVVPLRQYQLIYELLDELKEGIEALLVVKKEEVVGKAEIIASFKFNEARVAGCKVIEGRISRENKINFIRDGRKIGSSQIKSMKHIQEDINSAAEGQEFGLLLTSKIDFAVGDIIEAIK